MKIAVVGTGHVGLVTAVTLARLGHDVIGTDVDLEKIALLERGEAPFYEPLLQELLIEGLLSRRLAFVGDPRDALPGVDMVFICVGTPANPDGEANLAAVERAALDIAGHVAAETVVVEKSTVPAGTAERIAMALRRERPGSRFHLVSNPEFLREGSGVRDSLEPQRILVGADSAEGFGAMRELYAPLTDVGVPIIETNISTAELAKHACNAFLALKISYANALARICELTGADVTAVTRVMGTDPRIAPAFLNAGLGYGGYCLPKDVAAFQRLAESVGYPFPLLAEVARINNEAVDAAVDKIRQLIWNPADKVVAVFGLAFKPDTDDVRFSPALALAAKLLNLGTNVVGYDPQVAGEVLSELPTLRLASNPYDAVVGAHALVVATAWREFRELDLVRLREKMTYPIILDGRNFLDSEAVVAAGFEYHSMGRSSSSTDRTWV